MMKKAALILGVLLGVQAAQAESWVGSWAASPVAPQAAAADIVPARVTPSFANQTIVQTLRISAGGKRLRLRFTNEFGRAAMSIGSANVWIADEKGVVTSASRQRVLFSGRGEVVVPPGAPQLSDPIELPTGDLAVLNVAIYLPGVVEDCTCHPNGSQSALVSPPGDYTSRAFTPVPAGGRYRAFLSGVEVEKQRPGPVVVAFGDSITDGYQSSADANKRYPDRLAERLTARWPGAAIVNAGISGNRLLSAGRWVTMGPNALARFDRDVLAVPNVTHVIVLEGVNDIGAGSSQPLPAEDLISAYRQLIARGHAHGVEVIGGTILPYEGAAYYKPEGEAVRVRVNDWIRTSHEFDAVIDFDAVMRDPAKPTRLRAELQFGDWLHPNDAGYRAMGDAVDLRLLARTKPGLQRSTPREAKE